MTKQEVTGVLKILGLQTEDINNKHVVVYYQGKMTDKLKQTMEPFSRTLQDSFKAKGVLMVPMDMDIRTLTDEQLKEVGLQRIPKSKNAVLTGRKKAKKR